MAVKDSNADVCGGMERSRDHAARAAARRALVHAVGVVVDTGRTRSIRLHRTSGLLLL